MVRVTGSSNGLEYRQHIVSFHTQDIISACAMHEKINFLVEGRAGCPEVRKAMPYLSQKPQAVGATISPQGQEVVIAPSE